MSNNFLQSRFLIFSLQMAKWGIIEEYWYKDYISIKNIFVSSFYLKWKVTIIYASFLTILNYILVIHNDISLSKEHILIYQVKCYELK